MATSHLLVPVLLKSLRQTFTPLSQWEDKYRQLILLGKQLRAAGRPESAGQRDCRL
jgi:cysteine desulfuration protein SufE